MKEQRLSTTVLGPVRSVTEPSEEPRSSCPSSIAMSARNRVMTSAMGRLAPMSPRCPHFTTPLPW